MLFECDGTQYDSSRMLESPTDTPGLLGICVSTDFSGVFVVGFDRWQGVNVSRADAERIRLLAERYREHTGLHAALLAALALAVAELKPPTA